MLEHAGLYTGYIHLHIPDYLLRSQAQLSCRKLLPAPTCPVSTTSGEDIGIYWKLHINLCVTSGGCHALERDMLETPPASWGLRRLPLNYIPLFAQFHR
ncbi:hypothetical protein FKM82_022149 [Ascaphus truei]